MTVLSDGVVLPRFTVGQIEKKNLKSIEGNWLILFHEVYRSGLFLKFSGRIGYYNPGCNIKYQ